eukprot:TRINITY_DN34507_c0_g1_i1.p1 TRINITY_DN34507_c0_g1~~TRINITY_DN34507_c0_g1_i1.p1  ORF type:complete len:370 (+),score=79.56 TRINITY_DN34507_c0_g1_i1:17-1126(+)
MLKQKEYNIADSNLANFGTDLEKQVKQAAANKEPAWENAGKEVGLMIWRIEKFQVVAWPKQDYGKFFDGDSYIVLNTYKKQGSDKLLFNVHFWLGKYTTQDEAGTAAYKTVELDDKLGGDPVQYREVQGHESDLFLSLFNNKIELLSGGVESGFRHVKPEEYKPRLLWIKGKAKKIRVTQVELKTSSLNSGDCFILDQGLTIYQWNGSASGPFERNKASQLAGGIRDERAGKPQVHVLDEKSADKPAQDFYAALGGREGVKKADEVESDEVVTSEKRLMRLKHENNQTTFTEESSGTAVKRSQLDSDDVFVFDSGAQIFVWIGKGANQEERKGGLQYAQDYLKKYNRPMFLPIVRILEQGENEEFLSSF